MSDERVEAVDTDVEAEGAVTVVEPPQSLDQMDTVIGVAQRIDAYAKAMDAIVGAVVKRSYPGDWVVHKKDFEKDEDQKANMGAAAAERMAAFVGITESKWTAGAKEWSDEHKFYTYTYEADFTFGKRTIHVISRVGTRDKFFGKKDGQLKPLEDVQEDDIKKAAFRACRKEGVRTLLGLRNVPVAKLRDLGFDITKINYVGFESRGKSLNKESVKTYTETGLSEKVIGIGEIRATDGTTKEKSWRRLDIRDTDGVIWLMWSAPGGKGKREAILVDSLNSKATVKVQFKTTKTDKGEKYEIIKVNGGSDE